jgi:hypothetical protein
MISSHSNPPTLEPQIRETITPVPAQLVAPKPQVLPIPVTNIPSPEKKPFRLGLAFWISLGIVLAIAFVIFLGSISLRC